MQLDGTKIRVSDEEVNRVLSEEADYFTENVLIENPDGSYLIDEEKLLSYSFVDEDEYAYDYSGRTIEEFRTCFRKLLNEFFEEYNLPYITKDLGWALRVFKDCVQEDVWCQ